MKKKIFLVLLISVFVITGCSFGKSKEEKYQEVLEEYARDFYEVYQKGVKIEGMITFEVPISNLKTAVEESGKDYDLSTLKNCKDTSKAIFTVNEDTREIEEVEFEMDCEK